MKSRMRSLPLIRRTTVRPLVGWGDLVKAVGEKTHFYQLVKLNMYRFCMPESSIRAIVVAVKNLEGRYNGK